MLVIVRRRHTQGELHGVSEGRLPISDGLLAAVVDMHVLYVISGMYLGGNQL